MVELSITAALLWGVGNFAMGVAARRSTARLAVVIGFAMGTLTASLLYVAQQPAASYRSFLLGAGAGAAQGLGWIAFAHALLRLRMAVAAPVASVTTVASLFVVSAASGTAPTLLQSAGIIACLCAIVLLSQGAGSQAVERLRVRLPGPSIAVVAGILFAAQALLLQSTHARSSSLVLAGAGVGVLVVLGITALFSPFHRPVPGAVRAGAFGGLAIFLGDLAFVYALRGGSAAIASAVAQMHPIVTAAVAYLVIRERPTRGQYLGLVLAVAGVALISAGS